MLLKRPLLDLVLAAIVWLFIALYFLNYFYLHINRKALPMFFRQER